MGSKIMASWGAHILVSVDDAENIAERLQFRKQHGPEAPLPGILQPERTAKSTGMQWIWCDVFDIMVRPWQSQDKVLCSVWDLLLQPWWHKNPAEIHARAV